MIRQFFCRHKWIIYGETLIAHGTSKMFFKRCVKCGRKWREFV